MLVTRCKQTLHQVEPLREVEPGRKRLVFDENLGNDSNLLIVFYVQIMPDDFVMQLHRF